MTVGVIVERRTAASPWLDFTWRPVAVLTGEPSAPPWTVLGEANGVTTYYAGIGTIELHRTDTAQYRDNLATGAANIWVVLRPVDAEPPIQMVLVTANPSEGEASTEAGNDQVDVVPMPQPICEWLQAFIVEHHVERPFYKRKRDGGNKRKDGA